MAHTNAQKKGDDLEKAVQVIESVILNQNGAMNNATVTIEPKKIVIVDNVKHEIDIFITIDYGKGYTSVFIFECKNWEDAVGKNEIIIFSEKVDAVQAQKGYFIAKSFGEYAVAQAKKDKRIELLTASTKLDPLPTFLTSFHLLTDVLVDANLLIHLLTDDQEIINTLIFTEESRVKLGNEELLLRALRESLGGMIIDQVMNNEPTAFLIEGVYPYKKTRKFMFQPHELLIEGTECESIEIEASWEAHINRPKVTSKFDIKTRGRIITYEFDSHPIGEKFTASFIDIY